MSTPPDPRVPFILLVDDDEDFCRCLGDWLALAGYNVGSASTGMKALAIARERHPDVVITDLVMPTLSGLELLTLLEKADPLVQVIFLTGQASLESAVIALREGRAFDYLLKPVNDLDKLVLVIERALAKRHRLVAGSVAAPRSRPPDGYDALSAREREVLALLAQGHEIPAIACQAHLSEKTVRNYLSTIYAKLGVANRTQAILRIRDGV